MAYYSDLFELEDLIKRTKYIVNPPGRFETISSNNKTVIVDYAHTPTAIKEAISLNIPIISILDTNCDPDIVDIIIPGNDDSIGSIKLILKTLGSSILSGQNQSID